MKIMKFGGASLKNSEGIARVAEIVSKFSSSKVLVVVSAMYGVTDQLISLFKNHQGKQRVVAYKLLQSLQDGHRQALDGLELSDGDSSEAHREIEKLFKNLKIHLEADREFLPSSYDFVISFGERLSSILVAAALNKINLQAKPVSAAEVIVADSNFNNAKALIKETKAQARKKLLPLISSKVIPVVTGFFASTKDGNVVTLGRGGSDYSATILANVLNAQEVILWKEVNGVFSSDPKKDSGAKFYEELSYELALSLAEKGAKVLHPEAMKPVASKGIVVRVKNTFNPEFAGTKIWGGIAS